MSSLNALVGGGRTATPRTPVRVSVPLTAPGTTTILSYSGAGMLLQFVVANFSGPPGAMATAYLDITLDGLKKSIQLVDTGGTTLPWADILTEWGRCFLPFRTQLLVEARVTGTQASGSAAVAVAYATAD